MNTAKKRGFNPSYFSGPQAIIFVLIFGLIGGYIILRSFASPNPNLLGDLNNDNIVNVSDLSILLGAYGTTNPNADINLDGQVTVLDLSVLLSHYGSTYTPPPPPPPAPPPPPPPPPSGGGTSVFNGDYETGSYKPWVQVSCSNYGYALGVNGAIANFGPYYTDTAGTTNNGDNVPAGQGTYFGEFSIPADSTHKQRCQNAITNRPTTFNAGEYLTLMVYVPVGWSPGSSAWGPLIAEPNYQQNLTINSGKALALTLKSDHVTLNMAVGKMNSTSPVFPESSDADYPAVCKGTLLPCQIYAIPPGKLVQGAWNEIIVYDYFTTSNTGKVQAWYRVKGASTWNQSVNLSNIPTLLYDATHDGSGTSIDAIGAYRGPGASVPMTIYLDGFTRSTSFSAAAAEMP